MKELSISLARERGRGYSAAVRGVSWLGICAVAISAVSCGGREEAVQITEKREFIEDDKLKVYLSKYPKGWRQVGVGFGGSFGPLRAFRTQESCEVTLSVSLKGENLENVNRWRGQFGVEESDEVGDIGTVEFFGEEGILVKIEGTYRGKQEGWAMLAGLVQHSRFGLCVFKMTGKKEEVEKEKENFVNAFAAFKYRDKE